MNALYNNRKINLFIIAGMKNLKPKKYTGLWYVQATNERRLLTRRKHSIHNNGLISKAGIFLFNHRGRSFPHSQRLIHRLIHPRQVRRQDSEWGGARRILTRAEIFTAPRPKFGRGANFTMLSFN